MVMTRNAILGNALDQSEYIRGWHIANAVSSSHIIVLLLTKSHPADLTPTTLSSEFFNRPDLPASFLD
jgi:hypothetical protein